MKLKRQEKGSAKCTLLIDLEIISKLRFFLVKDVNSSTNEFLIKVMQNTQKLVNEKDMFKEYLHFLRQHTNPNLVAATFYHNILNYKHIFSKMGNTTRLYRELVEADVANRQSFAFHNELDDMAVVDIELCSFLMLIIELILRDRKIIGSQNFLQFSLKLTPNRYVFFHAEK